MRDSLLYTSIIAISCALAGPAFANEDAVASDLAPDEAHSGEIVVTATKRSESINKVPMSITAATGDQLQALGVTDVAGLSKVVPGFVAQDSSYGTPVYYLRGVGFYEQSAIVKAPVGIYVDEVPIPYPVMSSGASFDLERVEVLKGPQGTLFGSNATGGAINYVAAKPTRDFEAQINGGFGRFQKAHLGGHISGPLSETLSARLALNHETMGDWQKSLTRPGDTIGSRDFTQGRLQLLWEPGADFRANLALSGAMDKSDSQAAQFVTFFKQTPTSPISPTLIDYPIADNAREADWNERFPLNRDNRTIQAALRMEYDLAGDVTLTSISAYSHYREDQRQDADGTSLDIVSVDIRGSIDSFNQELRLSGDTGSLRWLIGGNYEYSKAFESTLLDPSDNTSAGAFVQYGFDKIDIVSFEGKTKFESKAIFGNVDYDIGDLVTLHAGGRYTDTDLDFTGCHRTEGNNAFGLGMAYLGELVNEGLSIPDPVVGQCVTLLSTPGAGIGAVNKKLPEDNVSWRFGVDLKPAFGQMIYFNVSRGYKSGAYTNLPATAEGQYVPAVQEELTAYELGFKSSLLDRALQLNGALFYYDYKDKQLRGRVDTGIPFRFMEALINVPESRVKGAEFQVTVLPLSGLRLMAGGVYVDSKITSEYSNFTQFGVLASFQGQHFPYTPKWSLNGNIDYSFALDENLEAFVGGDLTYRSAASGDFVPDERVAVDGYTLLDLRAGLEAADKTWRVSLYGRNVTDKYYWTTATRRADAIVRFAGMPATYGVDFSVNF